jgi:hypothetical protein
MIERELVGVHFQGELGLLARQGEEDRESAVPAAPWRPSAASRPVPSRVVVEMMRSSQIEGCGGQVDLQGLHKEQRVVDGSTSGRKRGLRP